MAHARLRLIIDAGNEKKARIVLDRFRDLVDAEISNLEPYHKGGFEANAKVPVPPGDWREQVIFTIAMAQAFGRGWALDGDVTETISMTTTEFGTSGLKFAWLTFDRE